MVQNCFLCKKKFGWAEEKLYTSALSNYNIPIPEGFGLTDTLCYKCFHSEKNSSKLYLVPGKYERELDVSMNVIGSFIPIWNFFVLVNLGWKYGSLAILTNYAMIFAVAGIVALLIHDRNQENVGLAIWSIIVSIIIGHALLTWFWVNKHNARVRANRISNNSSIS